jgi:hypothetical protein
VVAYYSHKPPAEIAGSRVLPADRPRAVQWMREHGVSAFVLENISYYRATSLFPDLASGTATPPFRPLGEQAQYQVPGGKPVFAYRLGKELLTQSITPGIAASIEIDQGVGKTAALAKGVVLEIKGQDVAAEGMGFGVPMVHYADGWVYSRTTTTVDLSTSATTMWQRTFELDEIGVDATHSYQPIPSRGRIEVTYTVDATGVLIELQVLDLAPGYTELGVLNEESASFDDFADQDQTLIGPKFGPLVPVTGTWARLRSAKLGVEWSVPAIPGGHLHAGREQIPLDFDWAGLDYVFDTPPTAVTYHINVQAAY